MLAYFYLFKVLTVTSYMVMNWKDPRLAWQGSGVQGDDGVDAINVSDIYILRHTHTILTSCL